MVIYRRDINVWTLYVTRLIVHGNNLWPFLTLNAPKVWHQSMPKKGNLSLVTNYRGISLMSIAAKIYNKMILNRVLPFVEPLLRKNQNGFRCGSSTLSQILCLCRIIDLALVFVDFSKAFDSIDRNKMFEILKLYGIPDKIIAAIKVFYTNTVSTVLSPDGETSPFSRCCAYQLIQFQVTVLNCHLEEVPDTQQSIWQILTWWHHAYQSISSWHTISPAISWAGI